MAKDFAKVNTYSGPENNIPLAATFIVMKPGG